MGFNIAHFSAGKKNQCSSLYRMIPSFVKQKGFIDVFIDLCEDLFSVVQQHRLNAKKSPITVIHPSLNHGHNPSGAQ